MRKKIAGIVILATIGLFSFRIADDQSFYISKNIEIFVSIIKEVNANYVEEIKLSSLISESMDAMVKSLDPYSAIVHESDLEAYKTTTTGEYGGIGAVVGSRGDGKYLILMPYEGFPAHKASLQIGDEVTHIDDHAIELDKRNKVSEFLKGTPGTKVTLTIKRYGIESPLTIEVIRDKIVIDNIYFYDMLDEKTGYIKLNEFTTNAGKEVAEAVIDLKSKGAKGIILDLRENPGGLLNEAINVANVFVDKGKEIVSTRGKKSQWNHTYNANNFATDTNIPLVILTSHITASAAEIVSGVMQDYDRGVLIGEQTFGKGLVQSTLPMPYNTQLKLTTSKYYIPSGRCIQAIDYSVKGKNGEVSKMADSLKVAFRTHKGRTVYDGGGIFPDIEIKPKSYSNLLVNIVNNNLIFHYATQYFFSHPEIASPRDFHLTEQEYQAFVSWMKTQEISYSSQLDDAIDLLENVAEKENYDEGISSEIEELKERIESIKSNYLTDHRDEVQPILEQEIISRYYFLPGMTAASLDTDIMVQRAAKVLGDSIQYHQILQPN